MDYQETLSYLYNRLPMFHRLGKKAYKADLHNTLALCNHLQNPQNHFKSIHIAGTNGKGSTSHMLAAILQSAGYKTGLYTSPHLKSFTERIRNNGQEISQEAVVRFVEKNKEFIEQLQPSFFEMTVGMAFDEFASQQVDIAVVEVGLGGRLDSTNIITPQVSVITNISWDHQDILGDTLPQIASEKAGIIKPGIPVVISEYQPEVAAVFKEKAFLQQAPLYFASETFTVELKEYTSEGIIVDIWKDKSLYLPNLLSQLAGEYQLKNLAGVLQTVEVLKAQGYGITEEHIRKGIGQVSTLTGLKGRWQILGRNPMIICDTGHNEAGIRQVMGHISKLSYKQLHIVLGVVNDKDLSHVLPLLPKNAHYYFCQAQIPRALPATALQAQAVDFGLQGVIIPSVAEAVKRARSQASPDDLLFIGGSTFVVAEIEEL
ncbi:folylpolyglutamate synthase/dihydrofolate synthase family protein [Rhodocytophaga aerolata]|uniref:Dihydrofolate synthase/folylpolyglutamate synthase n=1 Tax=Rhodocytophaga aerolata TaxID=455078 RepID=A0ABT8R5I2_9BACT|nr:folylpolyglutamate synthase/dihydrofolate synthase family protein [Rhodocytophaga aerolata]MDO1447184.1 folylpolyglutamate synthase/dihydrofolate synthase family protein [Rhodocytophaga aerolata]